MHRLNSEPLLPRTESLERRVASLSAENARLRAQIARHVQLSEEDARVIAELRAELFDRQSLPAFLTEAFNSGDGTYKP